MKIAIVSSAGESLVKFRGHLIQEWIRRGCDVWCISIEPSEKIGSEIAKLGAQYYQVDGSRTGTSIFEGISMIQKYTTAFKYIQPDICFLYMSKPIAFGGIAAIRSRVNKIYVFQTGLEIAFYSKGVKNAFLRVVLKTLYRYVQNHAHVVFFMSHSDIERMLTWKCVKRDKICYVDGSGVDMDKFEYYPLPKEAIVLMTARLVWSKGIREYANAAKIVKEKHPNTRFLLVGGIDENSEALSKEELDGLVAQGIIEYMGYQKDVRPYLHMCSIFVLPSYHEGKGTAILEAQAVGRPIVTTLAPGCGETVIDNYNGLRVPIRNSIKLAEAIKYLVDNPDERERMSRNAYDYCKKTFDSRIIDKIISDKMGI